MSPWDVTVTVPVNGRVRKGAVEARLDGELKYIREANLQSLRERRRVAKELAEITGGQPENLEAELQREWTKKLYEQHQKQEQAEPNKEMNGAGCDQDDGPHYTDLGNAQRLAKAHGQDLHHVHPWSKALVWDGTRWQLDATAEVTRFAKETITTLFREAARDIKEIGERLEKATAEEREQLARWYKRASKNLSHALKCEAAPRINAMLDLVRSEPGIPVLPAALDRDSMLLNCPNGTLELRTGKLREHRREDLVTKLCPVDYYADAQCPLFLTVLDKIFARNDELIGYVQRLLGYCLTGDVSEQILAIWWGTGSNGKSTLLNLVLEMLGEDYAIKGAPDLLVAKNTAHPTERADLLGKRLVASIETEESQRLAESLVKDLTGGDRQRARRMREDFWEFTPTHKLILCTNHVPSIRGTDHAIWRRIRLVPFEVTIPDREQDKHLSAKLRSELPGVLAWAVRGCLDWQQNGLGSPEVVLKATENYRSAQDLLGIFLGEHCMVNSELQVRANVFYERFVAWCRNSGELGSADAPSQRKVGEALTEKGFQRRVSNGTWYRGFGLRSEPEDPGEE